MRLSITLVTALVTGSICLSAQAKLGDYNLNGAVDAADYTLWRNNFHTNNPLANDNGLGTPIGVAHYALWRGNYGVGAASAATAGVPEPSAAMLAILGLGLLFTRMRRFA